MTRYWSRRADQWPSGCKTVSSVQVWSVLALHPAVIGCVVISVPGATCDDGVHGVVVPAAGATVTLDELRAFWAERLAGYEAPRSMELAAALWLSAAGKVLTGQVRRPHRVGHERVIH